jgi:hypothetical protein
LLQALYCNLNVLLSSLLRFLVKRVEYVYSVIKPGYVNNSILALAVNSNLANTTSNTRHGLPVAGLQAKLHTVQLVAGVPSWCYRKGPQVLKRGAYEIELFEHLKDIKKMIINQVSYIELLDRSFNRLAVGNGIRIFLQNARKGADANGQVLPEIGAD